MSKSIAQPTGEQDFLLRRFEFKSLDTAGSFTGYAAVFNVPDELGDVCLPGCFADSIAEWNARGVGPRLRWQHYEPIGHILFPGGMAEDARGLLVAGQFWDEDVIAAVRESMPDAEHPDRPGVGMSFAFRADPGDTYRDNYRRMIRRAYLEDDITITINPVNKLAAVVELKSNDGGETLPSERQLEGILRDAGCSRKQAKGLLSGGISSLRDAGAGELAGSLRSLLGAIKNI